MDFNERAKVKTQLCLVSIIGSSIPLLTESYKISIPNDGNVVEHDLTTEAKRKYLCFAHSVTLMPSATKKMVHSRTSQLNRDETTHKHELVRIAHMTREHQIGIN